MCMCVRVCASVCLYVCLVCPQAIKNHLHEIKPPNESYFLYVILGIDIINGWDLSNEVHHELLLAKKGNTVLAVYFTVK